MLISQLIEEVRQELRYPLSTQPNRETVLLQLRHAFQKMHNRLVNKTAPWALESTEVTFGPGDQFGTLVAAGNVGVLQYIHTVKESDPSHDQREIPLVKPQNLDQFYQGPLNAAGSDEHSAVVMAPFYQSGVLKLMVRPVPQVSATYKLWYKPGTFSYDQIGSEPPHPQYHPMVAADAAIQLLDQCEWLGVAKDDRDARIAGRLAALTIKYQEYLEDFKQFASSLEIAQPRRRRAFGDDYLEETQGFPVNYGALGG